MSTSGQAQAPKPRKRNKKPWRGQKADFLSVQPERNFRGHVTSFPLTYGQNRLREGKCSFQVSQSLRCMVMCENAESFSATRMWWTKADRLSRQWLQSVSVWSGTLACVGSSQLTRKATEKQGTVLKYTKNACPVSWCRSKGPQPRHPSIRSPGKPLVHSREPPGIWTSMLPDYSLSSIPWTSCAHPLSPASCSPTLDHCCVWLHLLWSLDYPTASQIPHSEDTSMCVSTSNWLGTVWVLVLYCKIIYF